MPEHVPSVDVAHAQRPLFAGVDVGGTTIKLGIVDDAGELQQEIVRVSLESGVLSRYTAFVAVDESEVIVTSFAQFPISFST